MKKIVKRFLLVLRDLLAPVFGWQEISILCYHSISNDLHETAITPQKFKEHLQFLRSRGHIFISLGDVLDWMNGTKALPRKAVALTFDDGYPDFETAALPILKECNAPTTLFVIGDPGSRLKGESLIEVGYHSRSHPNLEALSGAPLAAEIVPPAGTRFFAYPGGHYSAEAIETIKHAGYAAAFSIKPTLVAKNFDRYLMPRSVILKGMSLWEVRFACTKAVDWYRALWRLSK